MTDSLKNTSTPQERRRRLEPVLRHVLATLPRGAAYTTAQLAAMLAPRLSAQADYLSTDLVALANAVPGLCHHADPELQTVGVNKGRMIRRKTWHRRDPAGRIISSDPVVAGVVERLYGDPETDARVAPSGYMAKTRGNLGDDNERAMEIIRRAAALVPVPDALTDALKRIDRLERLLISFGYQLPPLKD